MKFRVSAWSIRNPVPVALFFVALTIAGLVGYAKLPVKRFPNIAFPAVLVSVSLNGAAPAEVENQITRPIENALAGIEYVKHVSSTVQVGASSTQVEFELGTDMQKATEDVRNAVDRIRVQLPPGIDPPFVQRIDIDGAPILTYAISAPRLSEAQLSWFIDDTVARTLQAERGVAEVDRVGGAEREINVLLDPDKMAAAGVTAPAVNEALRGFNTDEAGGRADIGAREQTIRVLGGATSLEALRAMTIPAAGHYVRLSDIAEVGDGQSEQRGFARYNNEPVAGFQVSKTKDSSEVDVENRVTRAVAKLQAAHPEVRFRRIVSLVDSTRANYEATVEVLIEGMGLAALVVFCFLRDWRATAIAAIAMPLSLVPTFAVLSLLGFSLNTITLLALTLVIGILVDDAIVEIENIQKRIEGGSTPYRASLLGADAIGLAVVATTLAIVAVFLPVSFMPGISGQFFKEFGLTVSVAVLFSLIVARFATPPLAAFFLRPSRRPARVRPLNPTYRRVLLWALDHKWAAAALGGAVFVGSLVLGSFVPTGFQPTPDTGYFYLQLEGPPGITRDGMGVAVAQATRLLRGLPEVEGVFAQTASISTGGFGSFSGDDARDGTLTVVLRPDRTRSTEAVKRAAAVLMEEVPDVRVTAQGDWGAAEVNEVLTSESGPRLDAVALELEREMRGLKEVRFIRPTPPPPGPELQIRPKPGEAARLGVSARDLAQIVRIATLGDIDANVAKFTDGERRIPIRVRFSESARGDLSALERLQVPAAGGKTALLSSVADVDFKSGPARLIRYQRQRETVLQADLGAGSSLGQALKAINNLPIMRHLPDGVRKADIGQAEAMGELFGGMIGALLCGIGLIYGVLVLLFGSFFKPAIILAALPLCLVGAVVALLVTHLEIDLPSMIGFLMLMGLAAKNSILLVEFAVEEERAGRSRHEALMNACRERARPIVMTTMAMAAGMLPTALGLGQGAEFRQPMAVAVIGGLLSSTVLSLVLIPAVYEFVDDFERYLAPKFGRFVTAKQPGDDDPIEEGGEAAPSPAAPEPAAAPRPERPPRAARGLAARLFGPRLAPR